MRSSGEVIAAICSCEYGGGPGDAMLLSADLEICDWMLSVSNALYTVQSRRVVVARSRRV